MPLNQTQQNLLRRLPGVDQVLELLKAEAFPVKAPKSVLVSAVRSIIEATRGAIIRGDPDMVETRVSGPALIQQIRRSVMAEMAPNLQRVVNATGVVLHTNLGRSLLAEAAVQNLISIAERYSNLEFDLSQGMRGERYSAVDSLICEITGAESAMAVNNNAGAVLLCLDTLAKGRGVVVSRGELIEIGGSFRIPDVMAKSGAILREVGTTNRTHLKDYESAIDKETGLLMKVHTSNYSVVGFTAEVSLRDLVSLGKKHHLPVMEDLGSGTFIDFSRYGMLKEPTVQETVAAGADVITFSGDKLLGGPQAGVIVGKQEILDQIKKNPITRALRIDKLTLAALESTLRLYRDEAEALTAIPTLRMLTAPAASIEARATRLSALLEKRGGSRMTVRVLDCTSRVGGGSIPLLSLPSRCVAIRIEGWSANRIETAMRGHKPPVIGRIEDDRFIMDMRTVQDDEILMIEKAFVQLLDMDPP